MAYTITMWYGSSFFLPSSFQQVFNRVYAILAVYLLVCSFWLTCLSIKVRFMILYFARVSLSGFDCIQGYPGGTRTAQVFLTGVSLSSTWSFDGCNDSDIW
jgi:hypothetical protein